MADVNQPIILKKIKKTVGGHGGGAWKVAYADFVTAMMAFFLLLWLLNSVTQDQLEGISDYFAPASISATTSGAGDVLSGKTIGEEGVMEKEASVPSVTVELPPPKSGSTTTDVEGDSGATTDQETEEFQKQKVIEEEQFQEAEKKIEDAIQEIPALQELAKSLMVDNTPEGLRIQLVDQDGLAMFPSGSAVMHPHTRKLLELVTKAILDLPQLLSISGHTDAVKFASKRAYGNWELSADRANNARHELEKLSVPEERIQRVVGLAATDPLLPEDPNNARNRRLSIILLRGTSVTPKPDEDPANKAENTAPDSTGSPDGETVFEPVGDATENNPAPEPESPAPEPTHAPEVLEEMPANIPEAVMEITPIEITPELLPETDGGQGEGASQELLIPPLPEPEPEPEPEPVVEPEPEPQPMPEPQPEPVPEVPVDQGIIPDTQVEITPVEITPIDISPIEVVPVEPQ